ncbi:uncharacterized protein VICG_01266, partial [Vittaforma corneae ATCC 50505]
DDFRCGNGFRIHGGIHDVHDGRDSHDWYKYDSDYGLCKPPKSTPVDVKPVTPKQPPKTDNCGGFEGKKVYIVADNGLYLARCYGCGSGSNPNSVTVHGRAGDGFAMWTLSSLDGKCILKSDIGQYAARCNGCWRGGKYPDSVFNHIKDPNGAPYAQWTVEKVGDKFGFKADTGKYMARCYLCVPGLAKDNAATVHFDSATGPALWNIQPV